MLLFLQVQELVLWALHIKELKTGLMSETATDNDDKSL